MKNLSVQQMEQINGGMDASCWWAIAGMSVAISGAFFLTGGIGGLLMYQAGLAVGAGGMITSC